jgi:CheY-like chemotaxis protein
MNRTVSNEALSCALDLEKGSLVSRFDGCRHCVLVVEDEPLIRYCTVGLLEDEGFQVLEAPDAESALQILERLHQTVLILFTDINMPGSMDGLALTCVVAQRWPHIRPFVTSGGTAEQGRFLLGHGHFIIKPYRVSEVARAFREALPPSII